MRYLKTKIIAKIAVRLASFLILTIYSSVTNIKRKDFSKPSRAWGYFIMKNRTATIYIVKGALFFLKC